MRISTGKLSVLLFSFTILIFLVITWLSFQRLNNLIASTRQVSEINYNRINVYKLNVAIFEGENSARGYRLTGDSLFSKAFKKSLPISSLAFKELAQSFRRDSLQYRRINQLEELVKERFNILESSVQHKFGDRTLFEQQLYASYLFRQNIQRLLGSILESENEKFVLALSVREQFQELTPSILIVLFAFVLLLFTMSYIIIRRQLRDRIKFQTALEVRIDALNRSNTELEQFAYIASHDLQEPLRKIQAFGDKLIHRQLIISSEEAEDTIHRMRNAASRMQILINELLTYSRLMDSTISRQYEAISTQKIINDVLNDLQLSVQEKNALITVEPMPVINAVDTQMQQLFQNLISNALKFSRSDIRPVIRIYSDIVNGNVIKGSVQADALHQFHRITVQDNGIGFESKYSEKIFVIFQRLHGKEEYSGTGIGLAICKKVVANHYGYILAEGKPMQGAKFMIFLPVSNEKLPP